MKVTELYSCTLIGIEAHLVQIETDITHALPSFQTVGLPDKVVKESKERVLSAIKNTGFQVPMQKIIVNLAPAELKKEGAGLDLAMAVGILISSKQIPVSKKTLKSFLFIGELALNGDLRPVNGVLSIASNLQKLGFHKIILPKENADEASLVDHIHIYPAENLKKAIEIITNESNFTCYQNKSDIHAETLNQYGMDFSDVKGQETVKRAIEIAAAGGHNMIMIGSPGTGKTMIARRIPTILPKMSIEESIETTKIHSSAGILTSDSPIIKTRPFRAPHHTISDAGLIGGGAIPKPGEVSLSHNGVLFLDELPEFRRNVLEVLRQPLEDNIVTISRSNISITYPARFILVAAMNPCPCGYLTDPDKECRCLPSQIQKYRSKISGPLLDRIDIHIEVLPTRFEKIVSNQKSETSERIRIRVEQAKSIQLNRFKNSKSTFFNAFMTNKEIEHYCQIEEQSKKLLKTAMKQLNLSARAYHKILKVSRTIADLNGSEKISQDHISEAIQYRSLDRNFQE